DGRVGIRVVMRAVVAHRDQRVRLGLFLGLAVDEVHDVGMVNVEDDHLGSAPRLATGLDDAGEGVKALHEAERTAGRAAAAQAFRRRPQRREVRARTRSPLEEHAFGFGKSTLGVERVFYRVDEARRALRRPVAGDTELDAASLRIRVPVLYVAAGTNAVSRHVE